MTSEKKISLAELQEILLWQSLNKQLIALKSKGFKITDKHHKALQDFCFRNKIFSQITQTDILDETKLSLISDFKAISFITVSNSLWNKLLSQSIPNVHVLDCTKALADSFDVLSKYDKKYNLIQENSDIESDDEELYEFINQYIQFREDSGIKDFSDIVYETHRLKSIALKKIGSRIKDSRIVSIKDEMLVIDLMGLKNKNETEKSHEELKNIYIEEYCNQAEQFVNNGLNKVQQRVRQNKIETFLKNKSNQKKLKKSVNEFVQYELSIYKTEVDLENQYLENIQRRINSSELSQIAICNLRPFFFLNNPLPLV